MSDGRKNNGGKREGAGRPKKVEEEKANELMCRALKEIYNKESDEEAKVEFIKKSLLVSTRGQLFIAEHLFGKATDKVDLGGEGLKAIINLGKGEATA